MSASATQGGDNKCSAAAEIGDRLATMAMGRKEREAAVPIFWGRAAGSLSNTMPSVILIDPAVWPQQI